MKRLSGRVVMGNELASRSAVLASMRIMRQKAGSRPVTAAKSPELTVTELQNVQEAAGFLETITISAGELMGALPASDEAMVTSIVKAIATAEKALKKLPANVSEQMNAKDYLKALGRLENALAGAASLGAEDSPIPVQKEMRKALKEMNRLHKLNPTMRKGKKGWYIALGAGTLAVTLAAIGAYFLPDELQGKIGKYVDDGLEFLERQGSRFMNLLPDWVGNSIDSFTEMVGDTAGDIHDWLIIQGAKYGVVDPDIIFRDAPDHIARLWKNANEELVSYLLRNGSREALSVIFSAINEDTMGQHALDFINDSHDHIEDAPKMLEWVQGQLDKGDSMEKVAKTMVSNIMRIK